jgi:trk system potassium uptake protein TrkA
MYVIILGCGRVGSSLAKILAEEGHNVVVIDKEAKSFERLGEEFNGLKIQGNGMNPEVLKNAGIERADAFCAVSNGDNTNIVSSQVAKKMFGVKRVIARIYDPSRTELYRKLKLDVLSGTTLFASMIRDKLMDENFSNYLVESAQLGIFKMKASQELIGRKVSEINLPGELIVTAIARDGRDIIPTADTALRKGDTIISVVRMESVDKVKKLYMNKE